MDLIPKSTTIIVLDIYSTLASPCVKRLKVTKSSRSYDFDETQPQFRLLRKGIESKLCVHSVTKFVTYYYVKPTNDV